MGAEKKVEQILLRSASAAAVRFIQVANKNHMGGIIHPFIFGGQRFSTVPETTTKPTQKEEKPAVRVPMEKILEQWRKEDREARARGEVPEWRSRIRKLDGPNSRFPHHLPHVKATLDQFKKKHDELITKRGSQLTSE